MQFGGFRCEARSLLRGASPLHHSNWHALVAVRCSTPAQVMAVVTSAIHIGRVLPYCLYSGSRQAPAFAWLQSQNVTIIEVSCSLKACGLH